MDAQNLLSLRPYLIRAVYEWCADGGYTPYVAVVVDGTVQVPMDYVRNGEIVLNVSMEATSGLQLGNEAIEFKGRFGGVARDIFVPITRVAAIYAKETGQGMTFGIDLSPAASQDLPPPRTTFGFDKLVSIETLNKRVDAGEGVDSDVDPDADDPPPNRPPAGGKPKLTRIK